MATGWLALDSGTTSCRAFVFADDGSVLGRAARDIGQHFPAPGRVEHDAEAILAAQWSAAQDAWVAAGRPAVGAVGIANQRETVVLFERASGRPVHRAIVWQDRRTTEALADLADAGHGESVRARAGLPLDPYFSAAKIAWLLDHVPGARGAAERGELVAGTIDAWLCHRLTDGAVFATEPSNASRTSLYDLDRGDFSDELLAIFRVPRACLPEIRPSAGDFGVVAANGWPIRGLLGDQQAALFGQGCLAPGASKCTFGTGAFLLTHTGAARPEPRHGLLPTVASRIGGRDAFALEGAVPVSGALVQWLRDGLGLLERAADIEALAASVPDSGGVVLVPALAGLGTPHWDADARGLLIGVTRGTTRAHIARAALEAMALSVVEVQRAVEASLGRPFARLRVDGGAAANDLLLRMLATLGDVAVERPVQRETTALGAARIAMLGSGAARRPEDLPPVDIERVFEPGGGVTDAALLELRWREAVQRSRGFAAIGRRR